MPLAEFEQRPPRVQALQITADNLGEVSELLNPAAPLAIQADTDGQFVLWDQGHGLEFAVRINVGAWVVVGAMPGPLPMVMPADSFAASYKPLAS